MPIPNELVDFQFAITDLDTRYFGKLPPVTKARGRGHLQGDRFELRPR